MFRRIGYVMVTVSDMSRSVKFYKDVLGLPPKFESKDWSEFDTGETTLALHGGGRPQLSTTSGASRSYAGRCEIGFQVKNLDQVYETLRSHGVEFVMPPTLRQGEGIRLAVFLDPDGLQISVAQEVQGNRPELVEATVQP